MALLVVPWALECFTCRSWPYRCYRHPTCNSQGSHRCVPVTGVQTWRDQPRMVDGKMVWAWTRSSRYVATGSWIYCKDYRALIMEFWFTPGSFPTLHDDAADPRAIYRSSPCNPPLWVHLDSSSWSEFLKACQFGSDHQNKSAHLSILSNKRSSVAGLWVFIISPHCLSEVFRRS